MLPDGALVAEKDVRDPMLIRLHRLSFNAYRVYRLQHALVTLPPLGLPLVSVQGTLGWGLVLLFCGSSQISPIVHAHFMNEQRDDARYGTVPPVLSAPFHRLWWRAYIGRVLDQSCSHGQQSQPRDYHEEVEVFTTPRLRCYSLPP